MSRLSIRRKETPHNNSTSGGSVAGSPTQSRKAVVQRTHSHNMTRAFEVTGSLHSDKRNHVSLSDIRESQLPSNNNSAKKPMFRGSRDHDADFRAGDDSDENPAEGVAQLTVVHKRAIRAIRKIKFFVARRVFKEALKPYDVKDVIEQYSAGHLDMLVRVKDLQLRLDLIVGHPASKKGDSFDPKVSLASRIVRIERQIYGLDSKLDELIDLYKEDRVGCRSPHPPPTPSPSPPSMHTPSGDPSPTIPVQPPPSPCPVEEEEEEEGRAPNGGHRIVTKQLSEPFARLRPCSAILVLPSEGDDVDPDPDSPRAPRALGYASSTGALGSTTTEAEKTAAAAESNVRHARTNRSRGAQDPRRCTPCGDRGRGGGVKADGFARYHVRCSDSSTQRLQETVALSNGSRLSFTSESLASEDESGSIVIDCSFPAPESCVV